MVAERADADYTATDASDGHEGSILGAKVWSGTQAQPRRCLPSGHLIHGNAAAPDGAPSVRPAETQLLSWTTPNGAGVD